MAGGGPRSKGSPTDTGEMTPANSAVLLHELAADFESLETTSFGDIAARPITEPCHQIVAPPIPQGDKPKPVGFVQATRIVKNARKTSGQGRFHHGGGEGAGPQSRPSTGW